MLAGAGDGEMLGLRRHLRSRRDEPASDSTLVLGIGPCGAGTPRWWLSDGPLWPLRFNDRLRALAAGVTPAQPLPRRGRGVSPAWPARVAGIPAVSIGCLDDRGLVPRSHQAADLAAVLDPGAIESITGIARALIAAVDAELTGDRGASDDPPGPNAAAAGGGDQR